MITTTDDEQWRPVVGYEGRYEVSDQGRVRSLRFTNRRADFIREVPLILAETGNLNGYLRVSLRKEGRASHRMVHHLVLDAFVGSRDPGCECRHLDGSRTNNRLDNLAWGTKHENAADRDRHGTTPRGEKVGSAKLTEDQVKAILADRRLLAEVAADYGVTFAAISAIRHRKTWAHISAAAYFNPAGEGE